MSKLHFLEFEWHNKKQAEKKQQHRSIIKYSLAPSLKTERLNFLNIKLINSTHN